MKQIIEIARKNKVLYIFGLYCKEIQNTAEWREIFHRRIAQQNAILEFNELVKGLNMDYLIVKTFKFPGYVPDDIDVLLINSDVNIINNLLYLLSKNGYFIRKKGTSEVTLRKEILMTYIDLDLHFKMAAGSYEYIDKYRLWSKRRYAEINGVKIPIADPIDDLLITIAHAVMKELQVTIADICHLIYRASLIDKVWKEAQQLGLSTAFKIFMSITSRALERIMNFALSSYNSDIAIFPIKVPIIEVVKAYIENLNYRTRLYGLKPLKELIYAPSSKGLATLLRHIGL